MTSRVVVGARAAAYGDVLATQLDAPAPTARYVSQRGWDGDADAQRGAALIAEGRRGLVTQPVVNRSTESAVVWLRQGGDLVQNSDGGWGAKAHRSIDHDGRSHWLGVQFLEPGPIEDALAAAGRDQLGQTDFGKTSILLDDRVLRGAQLLRADWTDVGRKHAATIDELDDLLLDRRILEISRDMNRYLKGDQLQELVDRLGPSGAMDAVTRHGDELQLPIGARRDLESLGREGVRRWLTDGRMTTFNGKLVTRPIEAIAPAVPIEAATGVRIEPGASAAEIAAVRSAAAERGLPVSVAPN